MRARGLAPLIAVPTLLLWVGCQGVLISDEGDDDGGRPPTGLDAGPDTSFDGGGAAVDAGRARDGGPAAPADAGGSDGGPILDDAGSPGPTWPRSSCGAGGPTARWARIDVADSFYEVLVPTTGAGPLPVVIALHGDEGSPTTMQSIWGRYWDTRPEFIIATPQNPYELVDSAEGWDHHPTENAAFLHQVIQDLVGRYDADLARMYLTGASAGAWFMGQVAFGFQDVFAAVNFYCGASSSPRDYVLPSSICRTPARFAIAEDDFLYPYAESLSMDLTARGHAVTFDVLGCSGHCCATGDAETNRTYEWMLDHTLCDRGDGSGCGDVYAIPE